ncbi:catalytic domain of phosphodiesterase 4d [Polychytrium aggregatum]|uniref:catalytic domain of phosphodiesterase 4d n=1 Tax=Polychytrium aggregatum TaxID=110093 RepID=UPI0022FE9D2D|nr:catalytic domain of phosphodiesterase 4d [Polychytrium aggregatum]KAI9202247.1 catalytic domain of phosphodiesterase 4d [Polychytrium aggregatum]
MLVNPPVTIVPQQQPPPQQQTLGEGLNPNSSSGHLQSTGTLANLQDQLLAISLLEQIDIWNWEVFDFQDATGRPLFALGHYLFTKSELIREFHLPNDRLINFLSRIEQGYHADVPYHNSTHATDVLHGANWLLTQCADKFEPTSLELMALYVAAIIHDFEYPGLNNNYLIATANSKAILYNDRSVLENHHAAAGFDVLLQPECNFISHLPKDDYTELRQIVIDLVLATDLQHHHFSVMSMFKNKVIVTGTFDPNTSDEDRLLLFKMCIKCGDVSNPTKKWSIYEHWTKRILTEFFRQGDNELLNGLPISPYYDRENIFVPGSQLGFIDFICVSVG